MKISENCFFTELSGVPYLFPLGQDAADRKRPLKLNSTGAFFWNTLAAADNLSSLDEEGAIRLLLCALKEHEPDLPPDETLLSDIRSFLDSLIFSGALIPEKTELVFGSSVFYLAFGDITVKVEGPSSLLSKEFTDFMTTKPETCDLTIRFTWEHAVKDPELFVTERPAGTEFSFPDSLRIDRVFLSEDASLAVFTLFGAADDIMKLDIFHAIRLLVSHTAQTKGFFFMHSVSLIYREKAWLFSAPSGTGKSTHAALWKNLWPDEVEDLNGDINLLHIKDGSPFVYGIPWNGTSGIYSNGTWPLGGIVILKRGEENRVVLPSEDEKQLSVIQRLISPFWRKDRMEKNVRFAKELIQTVPVWHLFCAPEDAAAVLMKETIDTHIGTERSEISCRYSSDTRS